LQILYRKSFLRDLKKIKILPVYEEIYNLVFNELSHMQDINEISNVKSMKGFANYYRIRMGDYRIGIEFVGEYLEVIRVLHRKEFYRFFP